jgi:hypothetical protein
MNIQDTEKLLASLKAHPIRTSVVFLIFLALIALSSFITSYCSEAGKEHVSSTKEHAHVVESPKDLPQQMKDTKAPNINQRTEGNQSPAVNVAPGGNAIINYGGSKSENSK